MSHGVGLYRFSVTPYEAAWRWQQCAAAVVHEGGNEALALLEHPPVYTFGRRVRPEHLLATPAQLRARGAEVIESDRGGDVTFHGPGQLVGYPILDLKRRGLGPVEYVRRLEEVLIGSLARFGIESRRVAGRPGVWTDTGKIAAIGVRIEGGVSLHGFALNMDNDLSWFDAIVPCGIAGARVTSMAEILGASPGVSTVAESVAEEFASVFASTLVLSQPHGAEYNRGARPRLLRLSLRSMARNEERAFQLDQAGEAPLSADDGCSGDLQVATGRIGEPILREVANAR